MKTVLVFGTFDFLHIGHLHLFKEAKKYGNVLIVLLARDEIIKKLKGKFPIHTEQERKELLTQFKIIDEVKLGDDKLETYTLLRNIMPDVVVFGYDQIELKQSLKKFLKKNNLNIELTTIDLYGNGDRKSSTIKQVLNI